MDFSVERLWQIPQMELLATYQKARRHCVEKKLARDTERGRLQWLRAGTFVSSRGTVTERMNAVDASEDLARKGQHVREMSHAIELLKSDIDVIAITLRLRGIEAQMVGQDETVAGEESHSDEIGATG